MLLGKTEMEISGETLERALQEFFDRTFVDGKAPKVMKIEQAKEQYGGGMANRFKIQCEEKPHEPAPPAGDAAAAI